MQYKPGSKSGEGYSLAAVGFVRIPREQRVRHCVLYAEDVSFLL